MSDENPEEFNEFCFSFKLVSGDTIICHVLKDTQNNIIVRDPVQVHTQAVMIGGVIKSTSYYSSWFQGSDMRVHMIRKEHIISASVPDDLHISEYNEVLRRQHGAEKKTSTVPSKNNWDDLNFKIDPKKRFGSN